MARTRFKPMLVIDPATGRAPDDVRGRSAWVYAEGTSTPLQLTYDLAGALPMDNPVAITQERTTPEFYADEGVTEADLVSGAYRIGIDSLTGVRKVAEESRDLAADAALAAQQAAGLVNAPADQVMATVLGALGSQTRQVLNMIIAAAGGDGGDGGAPMDLEDLRFTVAAMFANTGGNVTAQYDATTGKLALTAPTSGTGTGIDLEQLQDAVAAMLAGVTGSRVLTSYDDATGKLTLLSPVDWVRWESGPHPQRPTADPRVQVFWTGPLPRPQIVASGTAGRHRHDVYLEMVTE